MLLCPRIHVPPRSIAADLSRTLRLTWAKRSGNASSFCFSRWTTRCPPFYVGQEGQQPKSTHIDRIFLSTQSWEAMQWTMT
eukprot:9184527-Pyramimonas_sp.AAC.1